MFIPVMPNELKPSWQCPPQSLCICYHPSKNTVLEMIIGLSGTTSCQLVCVVVKLRVVVDRVGKNVI